MGVVQVGFGAALLTPLTSPACTCCLKLEISSGVSTERAPNWLRCLVVNSACFWSALSVAGSQVQESLSASRVATTKVVLRGSAWSSSMLTFATVGRGPEGPIV